MKALCFGQDELWVVFRVGRIYRAQPLLPSSDGWTRCPHPCTGPGCQFVVFSFDSSYSIITSFGTLVSVIFRTIQGAVYLWLLATTAHQGVTPVTDRTSSFVSGVTTPH